MKALILVLVALTLPLALAPLAEAGPLAPPVCMKKTVSAAGTTVTAQVTCEVEAEVTHCPPAGAGRCWAVIVETAPTMEKVRDALTCTCPPL
jgi:hypothetical protein